MLQAAQFSSSCSSALAPWLQWSKATAWSCVAVDIQGPLLLCVCLSHQSMILMAKLCQKKSSTVKPCFLCLNGMHRMVGDICRLIFHCLQAQCCNINSCCCCSFCCSCRFALHIQQYNYCYMAYTAYATIGVALTPSEGCNSCNMHPAACTCTLCWPCQANAPSIALRSSSGYKVKV